jgi:F5/8 type C domain-containing protein
MRKAILSPDADHVISSSDHWLNLEELASVGVSSENPSYPFENALHGAARGGWKAATSGPQTIRLTFDKPQSIRRIRLEFLEDGPERIQEFTLHSIHTNQNRKEVMRQQWNFSPAGSTEEIEDIPVELSDVIGIELRIDPGRHDKHRIASLQSIALA